MLLQEMLGYGARRGIRMKLNTVVCGPNIQMMSTLVLELMPERWKIFRFYQLKDKMMVTLILYLSKKTNLKTGCFAISTSNHEDAICS